MAELTHFNQSGDAHMVDVGQKPDSHRVAVASGVIRMLPATLELLQSGNHKKGDVLGIARIAGIMASKKTAELVPLCHPLSLTHVEVSFEVVTDESLVRATARTETHGPTGVEMEALNAVQVSLLTIYDMCKAVDRGMQIDQVRLLEKLGGQSGHWQAGSSA